MASPGTHIYRLTPIAEPDDTNWDRTTNQGVVLVRALSTGDARAVAAHAEALAAGKPPHEGGTQVIASAFYDPHLYHVSEVGDGPYPAQGARGVLEGAFKTPAGFVPARD